MRIPVVTTLYEAGLAWNRDNASFLGAALAYYGLFSIAPLLIIAIAIVGLVFGPQVVEDRMVEELREYIGIESAHNVRELVRKAWPPTTSLWATIVGPAVLVIAAANFFRQLRIALDMLWELPDLPVMNVFKSTLINYLLAILMVLVTGCFWLVLLAGDTALGYFIDQVGTDLPGGQRVWHVGRFVLLAGLLTFFLALTFRFLSHGRIRYGHLWPGATVGAALFLLGRYLFGMYLKYMGDSLTTAFGAASSLVIFLVWIYYSAQIFFYAAEVVKVRYQADFTPSPPAQNVGPVAAKK